ncbi:MAG: GNAT family N-acetyltransferase [SAR202 cluster bacterium Io17-Chloro-G9]|nr:MAG: GNAT family N-acetyltransferase [SAR202 cluster bacterium Io17-Chloro-G9]
MAATIRLAREEDAGQMLDIYAPIVRNTAISFELEPPAVEEFKNRVTESLGVAPWLVCESDGSVFGYAYAGRHRAREAYQWSVEVSVYVAESQHRQGVGRALYTSLIACLRVQGFQNAYAGITLPNPASVALHESLAFQPVGVYRNVGYKLGEWHSVGWWELALHDHSAPADPLRLGDVVDTPTWQQAISSGESLLR